MRSTDVVSVPRSADTGPVDPDEVQRRQSAAMLRGYRHLFRADSVPSDDHRTGRDHVNQDQLDLLRYIAEEGRAEPRMLPQLADHFERSQNEILDDSADLKTMGLASWEPFGASITPGSPLALEITQAGLDALAKVLATPSRCPVCGAPLTEGLMDRAGAGRRPVGMPFFECDHCGKAFDASRNELPRHPYETDDKPES